MSTLTGTDSYKLSHKSLMDPKTEFIYSNLTARSAKYLPVDKKTFDNKAVFFGLQHFIKDYLIREWNRDFFGQPKEKVIGAFKRRCDTFLGKDALSMDHFAELHDLGYLPLKIKALPEGSRVNLRVPFFTVINTHPRFAWLTNYLETVISCEIWKPCTTATIAFELRRLISRYAMETVGHLAGTQFQIHGFECRGMSGRHDAAISGAGPLLSFWGTDTLMAIDLLEQSYNADAEKELIACSVPASEHSVSSLGTALVGELEFFRKAITKDYPTGIISLVSDTYDFFRVVTEFAGALKEDILNRKPNALGLAKVVFRPDSGDQVKIVCGIPVKEIKDGDASGYVKDLQTATALMQEFLEEQVSEETPHGERGNDTPSEYFRYGGKVYNLTLDIFWNRHDKQYYYMDGVTVKSCKEVALTPEQKGAVECLWDIFGGTVSEKGYKILHERCGLIYGDGCSPAVIQRILDGLKAKGYASSNCVFGVGSWTYGCRSRDDLGIAIKATWAQVDGQGYDIYKDPKTDDGLKKSARGLLRVDKVGNDYVLKDRCSREEEEGGELRTVFHDGALCFQTSLQEMRERINAAL